MFTYFTHKTYSVRHFKHLTANQLCYFIAIYFKVKFPSKPLKGFTYFTCKKSKNFSLYLHVYILIFPRSLF